MVIDWAGDQFKMRPIMAYPPLIGQVSQLAQGGQMYGGGGVANDSRNPHVPHHHHCGASGDREKSRVDNNAMYASNKDYHMSLNGERDRGQWGVRHDAPHTPTRAVHDAWDGPPNPYYDETESYEDDHEGEGYDDYDYEYECQDRSDGPRRDPAGERLDHSSHTISRLGRERGEAVEYPEDRPNPPLTHLPEYMSVQFSGGPDDRPNPPLTHLPEYMSVQCSGGPDDRPNPPLTHLPEYMSGQCLGDPDDRPNPPLTHLPEYMLVPCSGGPDDRPNPPLTHL